MPERDIFEKQITVEAGDIDMLGHVNNLVYLRWVQEVAVDHWMAAADPADIEQLLWVITRQEIDYRRPAFEGDTVVARTWVGHADRKAFDRHTEIVRARDGKVLAQARTVWCPIARETMRPVEVGARVRERFSIPQAD